MVENFEKDVEVEDSPDLGTKEADTSGVIDVEKEIEVVSSKIEDGVHNGVISKIEYRYEPYEYVDIYIIPDGSTLELKVGFSQYLSPGSALGQFLERSGIQLVKGAKLNLYNLLVTKKVKFQTYSESVKIIDKKTKKPISMIVARIVKESVKLI